MIKNSNWTLDVCWVPNTNDADNGKLLFKLNNLSEQAVQGYRLCFNSQLRSQSKASALHIESGSTSQHHSVDILTVDGTFHEVKPVNQTHFPAGESWSFELSNLIFKPRHANDGPVSAFVVLEDGHNIPVQVQPMLNASEQMPSASQHASTDANTSTRTSTHSHLAKNEGKPNKLLLGVTPYPNQVTLSSSAITTVPDSLFLIPSSNPELAEQVSIAENTRAQLYPHEPAIFTETSSNTSAIAAVHLAACETCAHASYRIEFEEQRIVIHAKDKIGVFYAAITLCHVVRAARLDQQQFLFPAPGACIVDTPRHAWRGAHLDVARQFYTSQEVKHFIAICAWYKMNVFHWHLSDDEGWRVQINAYPELTEIASLRAYGHAIPPQYGDDAEGHSGYYTQSDVVDIVAFAERLHVQVMPEIDMPAHATAAIRALPWLQDPSEKLRSYESIQGFHNNALNPALETTTQFVCQVLDELIPLFPNKVFHLGGDEVPESAWCTSAAANALLKQQGWSSTTDLQAHFLSNAQQHLAKHNKIMGLWDDGVSTNIDPNNALVFVWRDQRHGLELVEQGYDVILMPAQYYYLDIAQSENWFEPGAGWAGTSSPSDTYRFDYQLPSTLTHKFKGIQCAIWSEHLKQKSTFNHLVFPRLQAIAESGWTLPEKKCWQRFNALSVLEKNQRYSIGL